MTHLHVVVFWVPQEGAHPEASVELNEACFRKMYASVKEQGYDLTLQTAPWANIEHLPRDYTIYLDVERDRLASLSREIAWAWFLRHMRVGDQALMVEPDTMLRRKVPLLTKGDVMLLKRDQAPVPMCVRLATSWAAPFYDAVAEICENNTDNKWCRDVDAHQEVVGNPTKRGEDGLIDVPDTVMGVRVEKRLAADYAYCAHRSSKDPVIECFNGTAKRLMLR